MAEDARSDPAVRVRQFDSAEAFLDALAPRHLPIGINDYPAPGDWIFRGHADATWEMKASAFRDGARFKTGPGHVPTVAEYLAQVGDSKPRWRVQALLEAYSLRDRHMDTILDSGLLTARRWHPPPPKR